jgi:hypothetical protein
MKFYLLALKSGDLEFSSISRFMSFITCRRVSPKKFKAFKNLLVLSMGDLMIYFPFTSSLLGLNGK